MSDWDERNLDGPEDHAPEPGLKVDADGTPSWVLVAGGLLALVVGLGLYWLFSSGGPISVPEPSPEPAPPVHVEAPPVDSIPPGEEDEEDDTGVTLPPLAESDGFVRELLSRLSRHPVLASFLMTDEIVRKLTTAIVNVAEGDDPARHFEALAPEAPFEVLSRPPRIFVDPRSYHRYDDLAQGFASLDASALAGAYRTSRPLFEEAYRELGYLDVPFETTLAKALRVLAETPLVEGRIPLETKTVSYTFADPALEALAPAQKHLIRMGPENARLIQEKLRELARALELPSTF